MQAERKAEEELKAQEERLQQELSLSVANRQDSWKNEGEFLSYRWADGEGIGPRVFCMSPEGSFSWILTSVICTTERKLSTCCLTLPPVS